VLKSKHLLLKLHKNGVCRRGKTGQNVVLKISLGKSNTMLELEKGTAPKNNRFHELEKHFAKISNSL